MRMFSVLFAVTCLLSAALAVQPSFDPNAVVRQVRGGVRSEPSAASREPFALDDGEFLIDTTGRHSEYVPDVAFDGTNFLVVWTDRRGGDPDIYGARVTPSGTVLDPQGFVISQAARNEWCPVLGFDGANFLVVWYTGDIYGARVTPQGTVLDPQGFVISQAEEGQWNHALGFDGANFLVAWMDGRRGSNYDIYGARVTPQGTVLDTQGFVITHAENRPWYPALGFDGANFLVVWFDYRSGDYSDVYGARVTPQGTVLDPSGIAISTAVNSQRFPALAFDGAEFLVMWEDYRSIRDTSDIYGTRVTPQGTVLDPSGFAISQGARSQTWPTPVFDGANFLVVWEDNRSGSDNDIYGARVTPDGTVYDEGPVVRQEGSHWYPALCRGPGSQMLLAYSGWAGKVNGKTYNTNRIWGKMNPVPGVEEREKGEERRVKGGATIVSSMLYLAAQGGHNRNCVPVRGPAPSLLDISGQKVMDLQPGENDVRHLSPGVYFVREAQAQAQAQAQAVQKVVLTR